MSRRILMAAYEVPGHGGASTSAYNLVEFMQRDGWDVSFVNIIGEEDADYFDYVFGEKVGNPRGLRQVHNLILDRAPFYPDARHPRLAGLIDQIAPDVLVGVDFIPTVLLKHAAPERKLLFLTAGCDQAKRYLRAGMAKNLVALRRLLETDSGPPLMLNGREREAVRLCDLVVTHADCILSLYQRFYPSQEGKIYGRPVWFAEWICAEALEYQPLAQPFEAREIDVLFIASIWSRPEKNYPMVRKMLSKCRDLQVHLVGEVPEKAGHVRYHDFVPGRASLFRLLGNARAVVAPSLLDAAPGILFEAAAMGCNVVASKNCGNWRLCHADLLVDPFGLKGFLTGIRRAVQRKYDDNLGYFLGAHCYQDWLDTLAVM